MFKRTRLKNVHSLLLQLILLSGMMVISGCSQVRQISPAKQSVTAGTDGATQQVATRKPTVRTHHANPYQGMPRTEAEARRRIVDIAGKTLGSRYRYGGDKPAGGFDCSGLMRFIHKKSLGIDIPRTAANQRDRSRTVNYTKLKPGDMLFFKTGKRSDHVGIYIGNRQFIHASTGKRRVMVSTMDSSYWHRRFVKFGTFL